MKSLDALVATSLQEDGPLGELDIDVSEFFGEPKGTTFFHYQEPDIAKTYQIPEDAASLVKHAPDFPEHLRLTVAMLAIGHQSPPSEEIPVGLLYLRIAQKNKKLFSVLAAQFNAAFPHLMGSKAALEEEKKTGGDEAEPNSPSA